jgi:DNA-binding PadR family transcriptional regulator
VTMKCPHSLRTKHDPSQYVGPVQRTALYPASDEPRWTLTVSRLLREVGGDRRPVQVTLRRLVARNLLEVRLGPDGRTFCYAITRKGRTWMKREEEGRNEL